MSGSTQPITEDTELDTRVDALVDRIDAAADSATRALEEIAAEVDTHATAPSSTQPPPNADDLMAQVSEEIESMAPGPLAEPAAVVQPAEPEHELEPAPEPQAAAALDPVVETAVVEPVAEIADPITTDAHPAPTAPAVSGATAALDDVLAAVADDLAEAEPSLAANVPQAHAVSHEKDGEFEAPLPDELVKPVEEAIAAPDPADGQASERPGPDVRKLDDELAQKAEQVLEQSQSDQHAEPAPAPAADAAVAPAPAAPETAAAKPPAPEAGKADKPSHAPEHPEAKAAPKQKPHPAPAHAPAPAETAVETKPSLGARVAPLLRRAGAGAMLPLAPLDALHQKLGEEMRQTIGYCAILTGFVAACMLIAVPMLKKPVEQTPVTPAAEFYDPSTPAHGVTAPPKAGHGESSSEHGEAKKEGHGAAKKDEHGAAKKDEHGAAKKDAHGSSAKKSEPKKSDGHGDKKAAKKSGEHH